MQVQEIIEKAKARVQDLRKDAEARVEKVRGEAKSRFDMVNGRAENVIKVSTDTVKKAGDVVSKAAKTVAETNKTAGKDLYGKAVSSVEKARGAGVKAVAQKPADFLPEGRDTVTKAFEVSKKTVVKSAEDLQKLATTGIDSVKAAVEGKKPAAKKAAPKRTTTARKTTAAKKPAARKTATTAAKKAPATAE